MEKKRKRFFSSFLMVAASISLLAFSTVNARAADHDETYYKQVAAYILSVCETTDEEALDSMESARDDDLDYALLQNGIPCSGEDYISMINSYMDGVEECGAIPEEETTALIEDFTMKTRGHEVQLTGEVPFADRTADVTFMFDDDGTITALSISGHYTVHEILKKAALNTVIGMGVVFGVLIFISLVISCFKFINKVQDKTGNKKEDKKPSVAEITSVKGPEGEIIDDETLAIISAVIEKELDRNTVRPKENLLMRTYNVTINGKTYQVEVEEVGAKKSHIRPAAAPVQATPVQAAPVPAAPVPEAAPAPAAPVKEAAPAPAPAAGANAVTAGVAGKVFKVEAAVGQKVTAGDTIIVLEAMKMEIPVVAPADGTVAAINVAVGDPVDAGQTLASLS